MKISELNTLIENIVSQEVKKTILKESEGTKEVYHIKCEGVPLASFESEEDAKEALPHYKSKHKDGELIIEKGVYESHEDMMNKLDEMNDQLEETDNMENTQMDEKLFGNQDKLDVNNDGKLTSDDFAKLRDKSETDEEWTEGNEFSGNRADAIEKGENSFDVDGKEYPVKNEEEECMECGKMEEDMDEHTSDGDDQYHRLEEDKQMCSECGGMMNEEGTCNECGVSYGKMEEKLQESKKKTIRLTETELVQLIKKMVSEATPGVSVYEKNHKLSGSINKKEMDAMIADINKNHIDIEGNDKPEFPHPIGKGDKVARENTKEQDEETAKNFAGLQNLDYDIEPSEMFKKRLKMAIIGDTLMGNAPTTEPAKIKPSNGGDKGKDSEKKEGNVIPTPETGKKIEKQAKDRKKDKDDRVLYPKEKVPVSENNVSFTNIINEEVDKMKKLFNYNKKTQ